MVGEEIELEHVFAHRPEEFVVKPSVSWKPPSTIEADLHFMPVSESAKAEFGLPFLFTNPLDAFSKTNIREQLHRSYFSRYDHITDRQSPWFSFLYESYKSVTKEIADLNKLFDPPFRFVPRDQFETVDLKRILNEPPEQTEIYLVAERRTYSSYDFLRIHSSLWYYHNGKKYLWFEKRLPDFVLKEDVLPWLRATIQRMPKRSRPKNVELWEEKLVRSQPDLSPSSLPATTVWNERPRIVVVFGPVRKVGYRDLYHIPRNDTFQLIRTGEILKIKCNVDDFPSKDIWTFIFVMDDPAAAEKVEREILWGNRIHFGLDRDIVGIVSLRYGAIHSINVAEKDLRELCSLGEVPLRLITRPIQKHKVYFIQAGTTTEVMEKYEPV
jgi:hypothetical protein